MTFAHDETVAVRGGRGGAFEAKGIKIKRSDYVGSRKVSARMTLAGLDDHAQKTAAHPVRAFANLCGTTLD
jgi:hypothetical protein